MATISLSAIDISRLYISTNNTEITALNSKWQKLNRDDIIQLMLDPDVDGDVSVTNDNDMYDDTWHKTIASYAPSKSVQAGSNNKADRNTYPRTK